MRSLKLTLAYDGTAYAGWQLQPGEPTVQGVLEAALEAISGAPTRTIASGRTDAGVHALGQVVSLRTSCRLTPEVLRRALNARLPHDVAVLDVAEAAEGFHAIRDACRKRYRYVIHDGPVRDVFRRDYSWRTFVRLDAEAMDRAAAVLRGTHDFRSFQSAGADRPTTVRTVFDVQVRRREPPEQDLVVLEIEADGFLYNMVRAIVGSLAEIGRGARPMSWMERVLDAADRRVAGPTAPPQGLFLMHVTYDEAVGGRQSAVGSGEAEGAGDQGSNIEFGIRNSEFGSPNA
jgi:tRNA pseudouridine38-40 synthase